MLAFVAQPRAAPARFASTRARVGASGSLARRSPVEALDARYELGVETLGCRRLVKGYSDTHARGLSKFDRVMTRRARLSPRATMGPSGSTA